MFYGGGKGTLNMGINGTQPGGRDLDQCHVQHIDLSPPELLARSLGWLWPQPAELPLAWLAGWYPPGDVPSRAGWMQLLCFLGTAQEKSCAALPDSRI